MKKQTAVEWLIEQMNTKQFIYSDRTEILEQAKKMEKEQMKSDAKIFSNADILNALHSLELKDNKNYSNIYDGIKKWYYSKIQ